MPGPINVDSNAQCHMLLCAVSVCTGLQAHSLPCLQRFLELTEGYTYPAKTGGVINTVSLVEDEMMPTVKQYLNSIPTLLRNGTTRLPKPIGADTKVRLAKSCPLCIPHAFCEAAPEQHAMLLKTGTTRPPKPIGADAKVRLAMTYCLWSYPMSPL